MWLIYPSVKETKW